MILIRKYQSTRRKPCPSATDHQKSNMETRGIDRGLSLRTPEPEVPTMNSLQLTWHKNHYLKNARYLAHIAVPTKFNSGMWRRVYWQIRIYVSKKPAVPIETEEGCSGLLRNVDAYLPSYTASHPGRQWLLLILYTRAVRDLCRVKVTSSDPQSY